MRLRSAVLVLCLTLVACVSAYATGHKGEPVVRIVNKAKLPADRLADALAAQAVLTFQDHLLSEAVRAAPRNPDYFYILACMHRLGHPSNPRWLLERALTANPDYLPALYSYSTEKPTYKERRQAFERLAAMDPNNAQPYYLMALDLQNSIVKDRKLIEASDWNAFPMTQAELNSVLDLVRKGNEQPVFHNPRPRLPSARDIVVTCDRQQWSQQTTEENIAGFLEALEVGDFAYGARSRQLARQAAWQAKILSRAGRNKEAVELIEPVRAYSKRYAAQDPPRMISFLIASAIRSIVTYEEADILRRSRDAVAIRQLEEEHKAWKGALSEVKSLQESSYTSTGLATSKGGVSAEEAGMRKILAGLHLQ